MELEAQRPAQQNASAGVATPRCEVSDGDIWDDDDDILEAVSRSPDAWLLNPHSWLRSSNVHPERRGHGIKAAHRIAVGMYNNLPLLASDVLVNVDDVVRSVPGVAEYTVIGVTMEKIARVVDANWLCPSNDQLDLCRVEFFVYTVDGTIIRYHPTAGVHKMPSPSPLFSRCDAIICGVGAALHNSPPGLVRAGGTRTADTVLFSASDVALYNPYDVQMAAFHGKRKLDVATEHVAAEQQLSGNYEIDLSIQSNFPWWLLFANTGHIRAVIGEGIVAFHAVSWIDTTYDGRGRWYKVVSVDSVWRVTFDASGKLNKPVRIGDRPRLLASAAADWVRRAAVANLAIASLMMT